MARLIDADKRIAEIKKLYCDGCDNYGGAKCRACWVDDAICLIDDATAVDAVEVVHGHDTGRCRIFQCSECGYGLIDIYQDDERNYPVGEFNYCPNCGAKMDLEVNNA